MPSRTTALRAIRAAGRLSRPSTSSLRPIASSSSAAWSRSTSIGRCAFSSSTTVSQTNNFGRDPSAVEGIEIKTLSASEYDHLSEQDMETMYGKLEALCEQQPEGWEVEYSSGVMTLITPHGTYVFNKQPPNQQIWISSPLSGPARFGYSPNGVWVHHRRVGVTLGKLLDSELKGLAGDGFDGVGLS